MNLTQLMCRCVFCGLLLLAVGCTDPMLGLGDAPAEQTLNLATRPAPRKHARATTARKQQSAKGAQPAAVGDIFTLYLVRDRSTVPAGPYVKAVTLRHADPARAIWLMDWLTEPSGQAGSGQRQFLVYADSAVLDWAVDVAGMVDVRAVATRPAASLPGSHTVTSPAGGRQHGDRLGQAIGALYAAANPSDISRSSGADLAKQLEAYGSSPGDPQRRWVALMVAGRLDEDVLGRRKQAAEDYGRAASFVLTSSPAWLVARYRQANALNAAGHRTEARQIAQDIVKQCGQSYSKVRAYRQAEKIANGGR